MRKPDTIRGAVRAAAARHGLTAYAISRATRPAPDAPPVVTEEGVRLFLNGTADLASRRLDAVFAVLGLSVRG